MSWYNWLNHSHTTPSGANFKKNAIIMYINRYTLYKLIGFTVTFPCMQIWCSAPVYRPSTQGANLEITEQVWLTASISTKWELKISLPIINNACKSLRLLSSPSFFPSSLLIYRWDYQIQDSVTNLIRNAYPFQGQKCYYSTEHFRKPHHEGKRYSKALQLW